MKMYCQHCETTYHAHAIWDSTCPVCNAVCVELEQAKVDARCARITRSLYVEHFGAYQQREVKPGSGVYVLEREEETA